MLQRASLGQQVINGVFKIGITFKGFGGGSVVETHLPMQETQETWV